MASLRTAALCAVLLGITVTAYLPVWHNGFVDYDDEVYLTRNAQILGGLSWEDCRWAWVNDEAPYWLPLTWLSLQLDAQCFPARTPGGERALSPAAVHGQSLLWHGATVLLLLALLRRLTGSLWGSFLAAALFAVHPMHVESVAWAIERKDVLSGFFGLLTLWAYLHYLQRPGPARYVGLATAYVLSLLAKPMLLTLPVVLLLLDYWPLCRFGAALDPGDGLAHKEVPLRLLLREKAPLFAIALMFALLTLQTREHHGSLVSLDTLPLSARLANAFAAYGWYVRSTVWPAQLAVLYPHPYRDWPVVPTLVGAACVLCLTAAAFWQARPRPWLTVGWLWFAVTLLPVSGLAQGGAQAWADRFSYWPHIGLFVALVWGFGELVARVRIPRVAGALGALVVAGLASLTWCQVGYWHDSVALWEHALAVTPDNEWAHQHLSMCYRKLGRTAEAELHAEKAMDIQRKRLRRSL